MDYTPLQKIPLIQDNRFLKMNSDTTALMKAMVIHGGESVLDIGTNQGALLLEVAQFKPSVMVGIDINPQAIELARQNMNYNHIANVRLLAADVTQTAFENTFDVIVCNPPFFEVSAHTLTSNDSKRLAKFNETLTLTQLMEAIKRNLSPKGRAYVVFRSAFLAQCFQAATLHNLSITTIQGVEDVRLASYKSCVLTLQHGENKPCQFVHPIKL